MAADARFAALLGRPSAATPAMAASPVKDPTVGEYGEWGAGTDGRAAAARRGAAAATAGLPPAGADAAGLHDVRGELVRAGYTGPLRPPEQEAAESKS